MPRINTPDGPVNFPDDMLTAEIEAVLRKQYPPDSQSAPSTAILGGEPSLPRSISTPLKVLTAIGPSGTPAMEMTTKRGAPPLGSAESQQAERLIAETTGMRDPVMTAATGGTLLASPYGALARITGGVVGGEIGGQASGQATGAGATKGGLTTAVPETLGKVIPWFLRSLPNNPIIGGKRNINLQDAANVGDVLGELSPPLAGAKTPSDLRSLAAGPGKEQLGAAKGAANEAIAARMGPDPVEPALLSKIDLPALGKSGLSFQEANDELSAIGARAFSKNPLDRTFNGVDQRRLYGQVYNEMKGSLRRADPTGEATAMFDAAQADYKAGLALLKPLESQRTFTPYGQGERQQINMAALQDYLRIPKNEAALRNKLGDERFARFVDVVTRGGGVGARDRLAWGEGRMTDAARMVGDQRGGMASLIGLLPKTLFPNLTSSYAGRAPYSPNAQLQTLFDIMFQRGAGGRRSGDGS